MSTSKKNRPMFFWLNAGAFATGSLMMGYGMVAAYAQRSVESQQLAGASTESAIPPASASSGSVIIESSAPPASWASSSAPNTAKPGVITKISATPANGRPKPYAAAKPAVTTPPPVISLGKVTLYPGEVKVLRHPNVARIAIGNGALIKATIVDDKQVVLLAEGPGETEVHFWFRNGREVKFDVQVQPRRISTALEEVQALLKPFPSIKARSSGQYIVLEGTYPNADSVKKLKAMADRTPGVVNLIPDTPVETNTVHPEPMIYLDLRVVEVRKNALEQLGIKWSNTAEGPTFATAANIFSNARFSGLQKQGYPVVNSNRPVVGYLGIATQIASVLQFLEQNGDSWTLAEPRLSCQSGGQSEFVAGGEIPIPVSSGFGQIDVTYKQYGVVIKFEPKADLKDNISSKISVEVSQPDPSNSINGFVAFTTNRTSTEVSMRPNSPLVISGLLRMQNAKSLEGVPGLNKLPILGGMFRAKENRTERTELLIVVTPRIMRPDSAFNTESIARSQENADHTKKLVADRLVD